MNTWLSQWDIVVKNCKQYNKYATIFGHKSQASCICYKILLYSKHILEHDYNTICDIDFSTDNKWVITKLTLVDYDSLVIMVTEEFI